MSRLLLVAALGLLAVAAPGTAADTTFERQVETGQRLEIRNYKGSVEVVAWERPELRVEATHPAAESVLLERRGAVWVLVPASWERDSRAFRLRLPGVAVVRVDGDEPPPVDLVVRMPTTMPLTAESPYAGISVVGLTGAVEVTTMLGDARVDGGGSPTRVQSMIGSIEVRGLAGRISLAGTTGRMVVRESSGELRVETTAGGILLEELGVVDLEASSLDGDIELRGRLADRGRYDLVTHSGDVTLSLRETPNAAFSVRAFEGSFSTDLATDAPPEAVEFNVGDGSARVRLESFSGRIRVERDAGAGGS